MPQKNLRYSGVTGRPVNRHVVTRDASRRFTAHPRSFVRRSTSRYAFFPRRDGHDGGGPRVDATLAIHVPPRIKAMLLLAFALVRTLLRRAVGGGRNGLRSFRENYAADGLAPITPEQRIAMVEFGGCIACGICDRGESERICALMAPIRV